MRANFLSTVFGLLAILFTGMANAASVNTADYAYEKSFFLSEEQSNESLIGFSLDIDTIQNINKNISNIALVDNEGSVVDFSLALPEPGVVKNLKVLEVSSVSKGVKESLADLNIGSTFLFDEVTDKKDPSWVLIDLKSPIILNQLQFYKTSDSRINSIQVFGGLDKNNLRPISAKKPFNYFINVKPEPVRFVRVEFNGFKVAIEDIFLLRSRSAQVLFEPKLKRRFKLLFGGNKADKPVFQAIIPTINTKAPLVFSPKKVWNKFFTTDADADGVENQLDNCPFVANPKQLDADTDTIGDVCDNAINKKNYNQADTDEDTIGDVIDNCKLFINPKQTDSDGDGMGDACDITPEKASTAETVTSSAKQNKWFLFGLFTVFILSAIIAYFVSNRQKKE